ncbi:MAG: helix-turn-helix domain-containing protein [Pirellulales bacterium]|nr:helix-turn-helix domain-containing protein [Pirellulales bacterium]
MEPAVEFRTLFTRRTAATRLGLCTKSVDNLVRDGLLKVVRIGKAVRFDPADIDAFIESRKCGTGGAR